tara:strand:- start:708 stop:3875 length:3168 start_codon:yes stop_codon:yes gene_type:complete
MKTHSLSRIAGALIVALGLSTSALAVETASNIRGTIVGPQGNAATNTKITIVHEPTGTRRSVTTNESGAFNVKGLRVGGPYRVEVDSDVFQDMKIEDIYLSLGETRRFDQTLQSSDIERIAVTGSRVFFDTAANRSYFGADDIASTPSLNRDLKDVIRNNPLVVIQPGDDSAMTIAGSNPRFNSISIDGIPLNDDFGLNNNGYPTQRNPFPLDALDQVSVDVAPTHANSSGFTGGSVDAVFKSGTNELHGNFFFEKSQDSWAGTPVDDRFSDDEDKGERPIDYEEESYGFTVGGPIIEDKLFFFLAYEKFKSPQVIEYGADDSGIGANQTTVNVAEVEQIKEIASRVYGVSDIGEFDSQPLLEDEKYIVKLDWNINEQHRANFVYMFNEGNNTRNTSNSNRELRLDTQWYNKFEELNNFSAKLYSDWSDDFSTEMSITQKAVKTGQVSLKSELGLGDVTIRNIGDDRGSLAFGSDSFRHSNSLNNDLLIVKLDGSYLWDEHVVDFGIDYQILDIENQFLPNSKGAVEFNSIADFESRDVSRYSYSNGLNNDPLAVAAAFQSTELALYVNDTWDITDELTLSYGLRYERISSSDNPKYNENLFDRTGFDNTFNMDGVDIFLPRFGFTYTLNEDVTFRGSLGRYAGGNPNVWVSNSYSNDGVSKQDYSSRNFTAPTNILTTPTADAFAAINNGTGNSTTNLIDPNFDIPSQWTYLLNSDVTFDIPSMGDDYVWTTTAIYTDKEDTAEWINASLLQAGDVVGSTKDGALPFYDTRELDILLTNADKDGRSIILSTGLNKSWDNGLEINVSYTYQDITEGNPGGSSTARSNYRFGHFGDHQETQVGPSSYQTEHRFVVNLSYKTQFVENYDTRFNLFFERISGSPYSYLADLTNLQGGRFFDQDLIQPSGFGSTFGGNYLAYVPTANDPNVRYEGVTEAEALAYYNELGLSKYAGGFAPRGAGTSPWLTRMDLYVSQEIPGFYSDQKGEIYFVVNNLLNLIDSSKGKTYRQNFGTREIGQMDIDAATGQYIIGSAVSDDYTFEAKESAYRIKIGVKYTF